MYSLLGFGVIEGNWTGIVSVVLGIALSIWGIKAVFTANSTGDETQFFKRYIVLSWIIGFRFFLLSFIVMIPAIIIIKIFEKQLIFNNTDPVDIFTMLFGFIFTIVYYLQFIKSIKRISLIKNPKKLSQVCEF